MADKKFTLFELHLHDGVSVTNNAPYAGVTSDDTAADGDEASVDDTTTVQPGRGRNSLGVLVGFALLVALAIVARKLLGDDPDLATLDELDDFDAFDDEG